MTGKRINANLTALRFLRGTVVKYRKHFNSETTQPDTLLDSSLDPWAFGSAAILTTKQTSHFYTSRDYERVNK